MEIALTPALLDTNILVYANNLDSPLHKPCKELVESALAGHFHAYITHQNLLELYAVVTDKRRVENPLSPLAANELIAFYLNAPNLNVLFPSGSTLATLGGLIASHQPTSHGIFDLLLVALMMDNGISVIHTANVRHFTNFSGISAKAPV